MGKHRSDQAHEGINFEPSPPLPLPIPGGAFLCNLARSRTVIECTRSSRTKRRYGVRKQPICPLGCLKQVPEIIGLDAQMTEINSYLQTSPALLWKQIWWRWHWRQGTLEALYSLRRWIGSEVRFGDPGESPVSPEQDLEFVAGLMKSKARSASPPTLVPTNSPLDLCRHGRHERLETARTRQRQQQQKHEGCDWHCWCSNIEKANESKIQRADQFAASLRPVVEPLREAGKTFQEIAEILNHMGMVTTHGKRFGASTVHRITMRFA